VSFELDLRLLPGAHAPSDARRSLAPLRATVPDPVRERAELLLSEVVTNSVRHAALGPGDTIEVHVRGSPSLIQVDVIDPGPGFESLGREPDLGGGWGVWLLDRLATRWGVERDGATRVWFELRPAVSVVHGPGSDGTSNAEPEEVRDGREDGQGQGSRQGSRR
jgi:Histidine kinase-like ATPase domain